MVTGGAKGIGLAIATHFWDRQARVIVADRDAKALEALPYQMERYSVDVTLPDQVKAMVKEVVARHERIDILVNNAGVIYSEPMVNLMDPTAIMHDYGRFNGTINSNLNSVFIMTSAVVEQMMLRRTRGVIVNISSISAGGNEGQTAYSAAKAGVNAMTVTWSKELGKMGIRCNAVAPGFIDTDATHRALSEPLIKHIESATPLHRLGHAVEVAKAVTTLIDNDFMNGVILNVNGGLTL